MTVQDLDHIKADCGTSQEVNNAMLTKWKQKNASAATFTVLIEALRSVERTDLAEYVEECLQNCDGTVYLFSL